MAENLDVLNTAILLLIRAVLPLVPHAISSKRFDAEFGCSETVRLLFDRYTVCLSSVEPQLGVLGEEQLL